ncbi:ankyrin repeat protein [Megavirus baoshan]|uniref:Ankyrin repeat protein n=1 Tax=Megavirus baoshan TaxID=2496520 RepID=A0A3Q8U8A3_9VIRU|nr:ankyrin repeat protein [Megavirus baoshan]AZL89528.1 ankyrin repeat protein [Megavirus baoshan]
MDKDNLLLAIINNDCVLIKDIIYQNNISGNDLNIIMIYCVVLNQKNIVKILLQFGVNGRFMNDYALRIASCNGYIDICEMLLHYYHYKGDNNVLNYDSINYSLCVAASNGHLNIVKKLVDFGADIKYSNKQALLWSFCNGHQNVVDYLVEKEPNANINLLTSDNNKYIVNFETDHKHIYMTITIITNDKIIDFQKKKMFVI